MSTPDASLYAMAIAEAEQEFAGVERLDWKTRQQYLWTPQETGEKIVGVYIRTDDDYANFTDATTGKTERISKAYPVLWVPEQVDGKWVAREVHIQFQRQDADRWFDIPGKGANEDDWHFMAPQHWVSFKAFRTGEGKNGIWANITWELNPPALRKLPPPPWSGLVVPWNQDKAVAANMARSYEQPEPGTSPQESSEVIRLDNLKDEDFFS